MEIKISVVIPVHNGSATIERCLSAVLEQKCKSEFEVIVVDDASSDTTPELLKKFPVRILRTDESLGAGGARNRGAKSAFGKILVFVDSDVFVEKGALERIEDFFEKNPECSALVGNYTDFPYKHNLCSVYHNFFTVYHHNLSKDNIEWFWGAVSAIRRDVFEFVNGFSEQYPGASAEDIELGYRLSEAGYKIRYFPALRGVHSRKFSLKAMLYNDYHKAVLGAKLYLKRKPLGRHSHGFSNPINGINLILAPLSSLAFFAIPFHLILPWILISLAFLMLNLRFYRYICKKAGFFRLIPFIFLHWLSFNVIAIGVFMGLFGLMLGKGLESRSRWI